MVEVKSSTSVKDYHRDDVAIQTYIACTAGVNLKSVAVAVIDSTWIYPGDNNYTGLLKEQDLTEEALGRAEEVKAWIAEARDVVSQTSEPVIGVGEQCHTPFECGFCQYCTKDYPKPEFPLDWLPGLTSKRRVQWAVDGITDLSQVPDSALNERQQRVKQHSLARTVDFDAAGAAADLAPHKLPAVFLDFETIQFAVPIWKGTRPYQQIPFQFSVHRLSRKGTVSHSGFLDLTGNDPSEPFALALVTACGDKGPVFVYNAAFETSRIRELAERFPALADRLRAITARVVDLLPIARARYYHHAQRGSWSIKEVLPAAVPDLSYDNLAGVKDGAMAMVAYAEAIAPEAKAERRQEIEIQLRAYCRLDTFAMVRLWQFLSGRNGAPLVDH
jgi:hypothetical protein